MNNGRDRRSKTWGIGTFTMRRSGKLTLKRNTYTRQLVTEPMIEIHPTILEC